MARTSRKQIHQQTDLAQAPKTYLGGAYRRLSVEDDRHRDHHSLENQENIILDFLKTHPDIRLVEVYTDNGETGTKFDRPDFQRIHPLEPFLPAKSKLLMLGSFPPQKKRWSIQNNLF